MSKFLYATLLAFALAFGAGAQTRRGTTAKPKPTTGAAAKPTPRQTPAAKPSPTAPPQQAPQSAAPKGAAASADEGCGCEDKPLPETLASVNGVKIAVADLSQQVQQQVRQYQRQVTETRKNELDLIINSMLLEAEAKKRGISSTKILEDEIVAKTVEPKEADAQAYFNQNRAKIEQQAGGPVDFAILKDQIISFLRGQRQQERSKQFAASLRAGADVKILVPVVTPPTTPADRARVLATVNGKNVTSGDIEDNILPLISQVQEQVYLLRKNDVDQKINDILLAQEAQKRGVTTRALLDAEVNTKIPVVNETQALDFYNKNKERINGDFPQVKYQIIEYLQSQESQKIESAFAARLRNGVSIQTFLTPPAPPVFNIATDDQPVKGKLDASVTVVEFTDYQCPTCAQAQPIFERLVTEYGDRVRFVVRDFPLPQHADAQKAAEAAEAAREQGKYWDFTAILFRNQSKLAPEMLKQYALVLGLDRAKFDSALDTGKFADKVQRDILDGQRAGVSSTPSFFVNGVRVGDRTYEALKAAIEAALKSAPSR
ncbi:MAG TPA: thioredoxin domain-containing protein [Pyrinomonadaceae bacterium]|nr:thioredoxin domain-containing protein [Pyrinomonadaceae bacterium]